MKEVSSMSDTGSESKTWLFTWNPNLWAWNDPVYGYDEMMREVSSHGISYCKWTCGTTKSILPGDRIFLIRLGKAPKGMVASGKAITGVFEGTHWDPDKAVAGKNARRVYIAFDKILPEYRILEMEDLKRISNEMCWSSQSSGISIPPVVAERLESIWKDL